MRYRMNRKEITNFLNELIIEEGPAYRTRKTLVQ